MKKKRVIDQAGVASLSAIERQSGVLFYLRKKRLKIQIFSFVIV